VANPVMHSKMTRLRLWTFCFNRLPGVYSTLLLWPECLRAASRQLSAGISDLINSDSINKVRVGFVR